ncbi:prepilin peptidase [Corynebacterium hindlerae]|uniref:Prepilin peptidase n=1 Tax=Corynebacterium hindlerae TaxID=699041 RepID=A0A7G5FFL1_9CORY|nr:prepilin peptidase [Corynebacterium hindlerae]QMV85402.1 prepilin peptidase [Corynebacterium hindlerae]QTH58721.1 prepilin peptidase [Corynebacterium hindlerae]
MGVFFWATALCGYDICFRRLPDWLTLPAIAVAWWWHPTCILGGVAWAALYLRRGVGGGDVKLAASLGTLAVAGGIMDLFAAIALASLATVLLCLLLRRSALPHGPAMIVATLLIRGY